MRPVRQTRPEEEGPDCVMGVGILNNIKDRIHLYQEGGTG